MVVGTPWRIGSKNRTFIRALLTHDYLEHKHDILIQQMTFMAKNPGEPFHVLFNYKKDVEIKVQSICLRGVYIMLVCKPVYKPVFINPVF
jgi:hypothetical protein